MAIAICMDKRPSALKPESWLVSAGRPSEPGAAMSVPPMPASNFIIGSGREYARDDGTPTWEALEAVVGGLESGKAVAFASGMAAIAAVFDQLAAGAIVAVDNTFATPLNQRPLEFGATVSLQAATKFIGGHSDLLAGVATTKDEALWRTLRKSRELTGATPGTLEAFLAVRGARTLALRLHKAQQTAMLLSERLVTHPLVTCVRYPGLPSHPTHATARRMLEGFGTIISFDVHGGAEVADEVCRNVTLIRHATSLGAVESTMERRAAIAGQGHLPPALLRLSVGIENADDLRADLDSAMHAAAV